MAAAPRLILFPFAENVAGDAVVRSWLAHAWAQHPHFIGASSQGCLQFGPLHLVLVGMTEWLVGSEFLAGRVLSLLAGVVSVLPLFALTKRLFSERAGFFGLFHGHGSRKIQGPDSENHRMNQNSASAEYRDFQNRIFFAELWQLF